MLCTGSGFKCEFRVDVVSFRLAAVAIVLYV